MFVRAASSLVCLVIISSLIFQLVGANTKKDINRKSIVFDIKTPKVFYCPQDKQSDYSKTIVKAKPLAKLCEFGGKPKPKGSSSDCYNDVDETEFACDEKKRFLWTKNNHTFHSVVASKLRLDPPVDDLSPMAPEAYDDDLEFVLNKGQPKKKSLFATGKQKP